MAYTYVADYKGSDKLVPILTLLQDFVDGVQLQLLAQTYFSKSKDQNISARFDFRSGAAFQSNLIAAEATVENMVNDINLDEFLSTAILDGQDQVFENTVEIEECEIKGV